jgi:hypothetical protein
MDNITKFNQLLKHLFVEHKESKEKIESIVAEAKDEHVDFKKIVAILESYLSKEDLKELKSQLTESTKVPEDKEIDILNAVLESIVTVESKKDCFSQLKEDIISNAINQLTEGCKKEEDESEDDSEDEEELEEADDEEDDEEDDSEEDDDICPDCGENWDDCECEDDTEELEEGKHVAVSKLRKKAQKEKTSTWKNDQKKTKRMKGNNKNVKVVGKGKNKHRKKLNPSEHIRRSKGAKRGAATRRPSTRRKTKNTLKSEVFQKFTNPIFEGQELSQEFKDKFTTLLESFVNEQLTIQEQEIDKEYQDYLTEDEKIQQENVKIVVSEAIENYIEKLTDKVDIYLDKTIQEWKDENEVAIEDGIKADITESFICSMKKVFEEHNIEIPESKKDIVQENTQEIFKLKSDLDKYISENIETKQKYENLLKECVFEEVSKDLTETEKSRLKTLSESFEVEDVKTYAKKLKTIFEHNFSKQKQTKLNFTEEVIDSKEFFTEDKKEVKPKSNDKLINDAAKLLKSEF